MPVVLALVRAGFSRHRRALVGLSVVLALGMGVAIASLEAARRTQGAYPSYLRRAEVGELVVNPSLLTDRVEEIIASTPGVKSYVSDSLLSATPDDGRPRTQAETDGGGTQVRVSTDGRYVKGDRPVIHEGRMIRSGAEAFVNLETAEALGLAVGDDLPLAFWSPDTGTVEPSAMVEPVGRTTVRVVGIGVLADEVLVDELYPRQRILVTPDVGSRYACTPPHPAADDTRPLEELATSLFPPGCATNYRYFALRVEGGDAGVGALAGALAARFDDENERLPAAIQANGVGFEVIPAVTADERQRVQRSVEPAVRALQLFSAAVGVSTLVVVLLGAVRIARRNEDDARTWRDLGVTRAVRMAGVAGPLGVATGAGLVVSLVAGWLGSGIGPVASAASVDPSGRLGLSAPVVLVAVGGSVVALAVGIALSAVVATRSRAATPSGRRTATSGATAGVANPSLVLGLRAALASPGARALLAAAVAAVGAVIATVVFSTNLGSLVSDPERFGWPYDAAAMVNYGYGPTDPAAIATTLDRPEVEAWGIAALSLGGLAIDGQTMPFVAGREGFDGLALPVVEGELPVADDEIALGTLTARQLGLSVGDEALVSTPFGERRATVRGLVVLPPIGPFLGDRASLGTGVLLPAPLFEAVLAGSESGTGLAPVDFADALGSFIAIDLQPGVDGHQFLGAISDALGTWGDNGVHPFVYPGPVRPATVADVATMRAVPVALAGVFALAMAASLGLGITVATRARRRELALLRALGATGRQLRASVRWHALVVVGTGLVVGLPLGTALGRTSYRAFATGLGTLPDPVVSLPWIGVLVVATMGTGLLAAAGPGRRAARTTAGEVLRGE